MELLIDTWNVLHQTGILPPEAADIGTSGLLRMISKSRWSQDRVTLVCDGTPSDTSPTTTRAQLIFTGPHRSADDEIIHRVTQSSAARSILVITSDRAIVRSIKTAGAQHLSSAGFLQALVDDNNAPVTRKVRRPSDLSPSVVNQWKDHFGIDDNAIEELANTPMDNLTNITQPLNPRTHKKPMGSTKKSNKTGKNKRRRIFATEHSLPPDLLEEARRLINPKQ